MSQYVAMNYTGDVPEVERKIRAWLSAQARKAEKPRVEFVETATVRSIWRAIEITQDGEDIALVVGEAGTGKTLAARHYCEQNPQAVFVEAGAVRNKTMMIREIARALDLPCSGSAGELAESVIDRLRDTGKVVIVDEADQLNYASLNTLRRVSDLARCGLVFIGLPAFAHAVKNRARDFNQIASRVGTLLQVPTLSEDDAKTIASATGRKMDGQAFSSLYGLSKGSLRSFVKLMQNALRVLKENDLVVIDAHVAEAAAAVSMR
jgi:DNA transposition AAA+ family ATPase